MKTWLLNIGSAVAVGVAFILIGEADLEWGQRLVAIIAACGFLNALFIPRYPKAAALAQTLRLKRGQKVEVEGK